MMTKSRIGDLWRVFAAALAVAFAAVPEARGVTAFWTGVNSGKWSAVDGANWSSTSATPGVPYTPVNGDSLRFFQNRPNPSSTNDLSGLSVAGISFQGASTDYTLNGNKVTLAGSVTYGTSGEHTFNLPLEANANITFQGGTEDKPMRLNGVVSETGGSRGFYIYTGVVHLNAANTISGLFGMGVQGPPTVYINTLANSGVAQSLGAGTQVKFGHGNNGGTIIYTGSSDVSTDKLAQPGREGGYTGSGTFLNNGTGTVTWNGDFTGASAGTVSRVWTLGGTNTGENTWAGLIRDYDTSVPITDIMGLAKTNAGKWILSGNNTYSGPTTVSEGTLVIDGDQSGATGAVSVASGATLGGSGTIGGPVTIADSATTLLYPNNAFAGGTLTCASSVTFAGTSAGAKFDLSGDAGSGNDKIVLANQTLTCGGATVTINSTGTLAEADYTLFDVGAGGTISGSFAATPVWAGTEPANSSSYSIALDGTGKKVLLKFASGAAPVVGDDAGVTLVGTPVTINVTTNDTDFDPPIYGVVSNLMWAGSTVSIQDGTNLLYTPASGSNGVDQFEYVVTNVSGSATGTVTVTVNVPPLTAGNDSADTIAGIAVTINVTTNDANFTPPIGSVLGGLMWPGSTAEIQDSTNILYTPAAGSNGVDQFQYVITNSFGDSATGLVSVTVAPPPPPTAVDDSAGTGVGYPVTIAVTANDTDFDPPISQVLSNLLWAGSTVAISGGTNLLYTPAAGSNGVDQFEYVITNAYGSATGTVTVTVALPKTAFWTGVNGGNWSGDGLSGENWSSDTATPGSPYTPVNGDGLRFFQNRPYPSSTNDLSGLSVTEISFQAATTDYTLNGNKVTVSGGITGGGGHTLNLPLESDGNLTINGGTEADPMTFNGIISETAANSGLYIYSGVVHLNASNTISGLFWMGVQSPPTVYINTLANSGVAQSLGAGTQVKFGHNDSGGTIIYTGSSDVSTDKLAQPGREGGYTGSGTFLNNGTGTVTWNGDFTGTSGGTVSRVWTLGGTNTGENTWAGLIRDYDTIAPITDIMGLAKTNASKWILSGNNTYSGPTTVSEGTLVIDGDQSGATGAVSVASGARLGGTGSIGGSVSVPSGATLAVEIDGATADELTISGTLTLAGNLNITHVGAPTETEYRVATASSIDITGVAITGETGWMTELRNGDTELWMKVPQGTLFKFR